MFHRHKWFIHGVQPGLHEGTMKSWILMLCSCGKIKTEVVHHHWTLEDILGTNLPAGTARADLKVNLEEVNKSLDKIIRQKEEK